MTMRTLYNVGDTVYRIEGSKIQKNAISQIRCICDTISGDVNTRYSLANCHGSFGTIELYIDRRVCAEKFMADLGYEVGLKEVVKD